MSQIYIPEVTLPFLYSNGAKISVPASGGTTLTISSGQFRDSSNSFDANLGNFEGESNNEPSDVSITLDASVNGFNGLDVGTLAANTVYNVFIISDPINNNPTGALASLSLTPVTPFNYSLSYKLIGYFATDSSAEILLCYNSGTGNSRTLMYDAPGQTAVTAGAATTFTTVDLREFVPLVSDLPVWISTTYTPAVAGNTLSLQPAGSTGIPFVITGQVATVPVTTVTRIFQHPEMLGSNPRIAYKVTASDTVSIKVLGFDYYV